MATSDKLITVAENVPKVYHAGQMNVVENAECLKGSKSGSAFLLDDISPVEHTMSVRVHGKNLFTLENRQQVNFGEAANTTQRTFIENSFYYKVSANNYHNYTTSKYKILGSNSFEMTSTHAYGLGVNFKVKPNETYTVSYNVSDSEHSRITVGCYDKDGKFIKALISVSTFTIPDDCEWMVICFVAYGSGGGTEYTLTYSNIQLELGTTSTSYTPYVPDLTAVKVTRCGKNLTNSLTDIKSDQNSSVISRDNGIVTVQSGNVITYSSHATLCSKKLPSGTYTFSFDCIIENTKKCTKPNYVQVWVDNNFFSLSIYDMWKDGTYHRSFNFKITKKSSVLIRFYFNVDSITETSDIPTTVAFSNVQLELGSTATDYEPYNSKTDYTPTVDGTVNGVTSLYPNITLLTDTNGVIIDCEYYKDIDKAFNELTTSVALSGGE